MNTISYYLRKNPLSTTDDNRYMASVRRSAPIRQDDIIQLMSVESNIIFQN